MVKNLKTGSTLDDSLFGAVKLTKNVDLNKYEYSGYSVGYDGRSQFYCQMANVVKSCYIWSLIIPFAMLIIKKKKVILVLGEILTDGLDDTTTTAEPKCYVILLNQERKIARACITMESKKIVCY